MFKLIKWVLKLAFGVVVLVVVIGIVITSSQREEQPTTQPAKPAAPTLSDTAQEKAIAAIQGEARVREAAITQRGTDLSLAVVVDYGTNEEWARHLGERFVRLVKLYAQDGERPGAQIGRGAYSYLITVTTPDEKVLAQGAKDAAAHRISWR